MKITQAIRRLLTTGATMALVITGSSSLLAVANTTTAAADCSQTLLTFPAWYNGLLDSDCELRSPGDVGIEKFIFVIAFNVLDIMLQLVAYVAIGFIIYGGFQYLTLSSSPDGMTRARRTIQNAIIGLVIAVAAVAIVKLISGVIA